MNDKHLTDLGFDPGTSSITRYALWALVEGKLQVIDSDASLGQLAERHNLNPRTVVLIEKDSYHV